MENMNLVVIQGRLGRDADIRKTGAGKSYARMNVAVRKSWQDQNTGDWVERTTWIPVITFQSGLVDKVLADRARKGASVLIQGEITGFDYEKDKIRRTGIEVTIGRSGSIQFLPSNTKDKAPADPPPQPEAPPPEAPPPEAHPESAATG